MVLLDIHRSKSKFGHRHYTLKKKKVKMDLNVKCQIKKLPEDSIRENLGDHWFGNEFFKTAPKAQFIKEKLIN